MTISEDKGQVGVKKSALERLNELSAQLEKLRGELDGLRSELDKPSANQEKLYRLAAARREAIAVLQEEFINCHIEINEPVRWANQRLEVLNSDSLNVCVEQRLLGDRIKQFAKRAA